MEVGNTSSVPSGAGVAQDQAARTRRITKAVSSVTLGAFFSIAPLGMSRFHLLLWPFILPRWDLAFLVGWRIE